MPSCINPDYLGHAVERQNRGTQDLTVKDKEIQETNGNIINGTHLYSTDYRLKHVIKSSQEVFLYSDHL